MLRQASWLVRRTDLQLRYSAGLSPASTFMPWLPCLRVTSTPFIINHNPAVQNFCRNSGNSKYAKTTQLQINLPLFRIAGNSFTANPPPLMQSAKFLFSLYLADFIGRNKAERSPPFRKCKQNKRIAQCKTFTSRANSAKIIIYFNQHAGISPPIMKNNFYVENK